jgi:iron(III) transport system substrate-binding protein
MHRQCPSQKRRTALKLIHLLALITLIVPITAFSSTEEIVAYSARNEHLIKPLFDAYTAKTGVKIKYITDKEGALL